ncbi:nucleoside hydrolase [Polycladidibacter stylochi]|uniref:nucleoside hydrolase n=1 Tax=Polycladidibacter stylochi TaxID=1807766 RepID=UPI00083423C9|nr:nucleoside hydrolase [Pseudovibrio stylochi]
MNKLIIDSDGGTDDILALLLLAGHNRLPSLITTTFGNVGLDQATQNIADTMALLAQKKPEVQRIPIIKGANKPLTGPLVDAKDVHGEDGLGGIARPIHTKSVFQSNAIEAIKKLLAEAQSTNRKVDILTLGPLTNLAEVLKDKPELGEAIEHLWVMGGSCRGRGNVTLAAEFNIYCDPQAADIVFSLPLNTHMIPWEPCLETAISGEALQGIFSSLPNTIIKQFAMDICDHGRQLGRNWYDEDFCIMPDPLAAAYVLDNQIAMRTIVCGVMVETVGEHTTGATILDFENKTNRPPIGIIDQADGAALSRLFSTAMQRLC